MNGIEVLEREVVFHRYYDPATGQFLSVDPLETATGQPYAFTNDNPVNGADPQGLMTIGGYCAPGDCPTVAGTNDPIQSAPVGPSYPVGSGPAWGGGGSVAPTVGSPPAPILGPLAPAKSAQPTSTAAAPMTASAPPNAADNAIQRVLNDTGNLQAGTDMAALAGVLGLPEDSPGEAALIVGSEKLGQVITLTSCGYAVITSTGLAHEGSWKVCGENAALAAVGGFVTTPSLKATWNWVNDVSKWLS